MENGFCINGLRRAALLAMMALGLLFTAACGPGGEGTSKCEENEEWAQDSDLESKCLLKCEPGDEEGICPSGQACASRSGGLYLCTTRTGGTGPGDGTDPGDGTGPGDGTYPNPSNEELCNDYCYLVYGCISDTCTEINEEGVGDIVVMCLTGDVDDPTDTGCYGMLEGPNADAARAELIEMVYGDDDGNISTTKNTCDATKDIRCGDLGLFDNCNCVAPTNVGGECAEDDDCDRGDLRLGLCLPEEKDETGDVVSTPGGMCTVGVCGRLPQGADSNEYADVSYGPDCGPNAACVSTVVSQQGDTAGLCMPLCEKADDCRDGYGCQIAGDAFEVNPNPQHIDELYVFAGVARICDMKCDDDSQCNPSGRCNMATGACEFTCFVEGDEEQSEALQAICGSMGGECTTIGAKEICVLP